MMRLSSLCVSLLSVTLLLCGGSTLHAQEPEKSDVFVAGEGGVSLYRIPGTVVTPRGTVLAYCEARKNSRSDWGEIEVHLKRSTDGGRTWSKASAIAHRSERIAGKTGNEKTDSEQTVNNPVAIVDTVDGSVQFLYCVNYSRCFSIESRDDGLTWSAPIEITQVFEAFRPHVDWKVLATGPGHGIQLRSGRLVVPVWLAYGGVRDHHPSVTATIYSDDHGKTWVAGEVAVPDRISAGWHVRDGQPAREVMDVVDPNESILAELSDGTVLLVTRSESKASRKLLTRSKDGASAWSSPVFHEQLWEPICMASLLAVPDRRAIAFSNPRSLAFNKAGMEIPGGRGERKNLSLTISLDDGSTWSAPRTLEAGASAYSDLAQLPDGTLVCFYEAGNVLRFARIPYEWLTAK
ncbi:MAG: sialidase family protein [Planctomycetaceae bacterium]